MPLFGIYPEKLIRQRNLVAAKSSIWSDLGDKLRRQKGPYFDSVAALLVVAPI